MSIIEFLFAVSIFTLGFVVGDFVGMIETALIFENVGF